MNIKVPALLDPHFHLRQGEKVMRDLIRLAIQGGTDILGLMPNTKEGLRTCDEVLAYLQLARSLVPKGQSMSFLPYVMLTEGTTAREIGRCTQAGIRSGKGYPFGRTTNSDKHGIRHYGRLIPVVKSCGEWGMKVHLHPEHPWMAFENRDAEFAFLPIVDMFLNETDATIVWEHGTDARCIPFWKEMAKSGRFFVTLTAHHLATDENAAFGDVRAVCKPPIKTRRDAGDLRRLVAKDYPWVMAGTDSAFHPPDAKHVHEGSCACGSLTSLVAHPLYAHALDELLQTPNGAEVYRHFTSENAQELHGLGSPSRRMIELVREDSVIPRSCRIGSHTAEPFWAGQTINWRIASQEAAVS